MLIRENGSGTRFAVEHHCQQHRLQLKPIMEMSSNESIKHAVIAGLGVGILPKLSVMAELQTGILKTLELQDFPIRRSWCLVHPWGNTLPVSRRLLLIMSMSDSNKFMRILKTHNNDYQR